MHTKIGLDLLHDVFTLHERSATDRSFVETKTGCSFPRCGGLGSLDWCVVL